MAFEPVKLLDGLTKGLIDAVYDFTRLTFAGLALPFFAIPFFRSSAFWFTSITVQRRLSPLSHLFVWTLIAAAVAFDSSLKLVSSVTGMEKAIDPTFLGLVVTALLVCICVDLLIRALMYFVRTHTRRNLYGSLARIAVANFFLGAVALMALSNPNWILPPAFSIVKGVFLKTGWGSIPVTYPAPVLLLFGFSLAAVVVKAFRVRGRLAIGTVALLVTTSAAVLLTNISLAAIYAAERTKSWLAPSPGPLAVRQYRIDCAFEGNNVRVAGFLVLRGASNLPVKPDDFAVRYNGPDDKEYAGKIRAGQPGFLLSSTEYRWIDIMAERDPGEPDKTATPKSDCRLVLVNDPDAFSSAEVPNVSEHSSD